MNQAIPENIANSTSVYTAIFERQPQDILIQTR